MVSKGLYNKLIKSARKHHELSQLFHNESVKQFGFEIGETNDDSIIDTVDYGIGGLNYKDFIDRMKQYKKDFDSNKNFRTIP